MAISQEMLDEWIQKIPNKCVINWNIDKINYIWSSWSCIQWLEFIIINWKHSYVVKGSYITWECLADSYYKIFYNNIPKTWEKINILLDSNYKIIEINKTFDKYQPLTFCEDNYKNTNNFFENNYDYFYGIIIFLILILSVLAFKIYKFRK